jgi:hypothetical protein
LTNVGQLAGDVSMTCRLRWRGNLNLIALFAVIGATLCSEGASGETLASSDPISASGAVSEVVQSAVCSKRYHAELGGAILREAHALQGIADHLREAMTDMPGYWLFWNGSGIAARSAYQKRLLGTQLVNLNENRLCERSVLVRGGRIRCLKWVPLPEGYELTEPKSLSDDTEVPEISQSERRVAASLGGFVSSKGAIRDLAHGTAFFHVIQRATDELIAYAGQPYRPAICSGAGAMLEFYRAKLKPLRTKLAAANALRKETIAQSLAAVGKVLNGHQQVDAKDDGEVAQLIWNVLSTELASGEMKQLGSVSEPLALLAAARDILTDDRFGVLDKERRQRLRKALRNIEFLAYAGHEARRLELLQVGFYDIFQSIASAHRRHCNCSP